MRRKLQGFLMTREMAYAFATDEGHRAVDPHSLRGFDQDAYAAALRGIWTLDDEFTQQEFEAAHGRAPQPYSQMDYDACLEIASARKAAGLIYGPIPSR